MWKQVSTEKALQYISSGKAVKVVDLRENMVLDLTKALDALMLVADLAAGDNVGFQEAVDDMVERDKLQKENAELREKLKQALDEYGDLSTRYAELDAAYQVAQNPAPPAEFVIENATAAPAGTSVTTEIPAEELPKPKRKYSHDTVEEMESNFQKRKIDDIPKLKSLVKANWKIKDLAIEFGCSEQTVRNTMKREGIA